MTKNTLKNKRYLERYNLKRCCIDVDRDMAEKFRSVCQKNGKSQSQVLAKAMEDYIRENEEAGDEKDNRI